MKRTDLALAAIVILTIVVIGVLAQPTPTYSEIDDALFGEIIRELERQNNWEPKP